MYVKSDFKNSPLDLSEALKHVRESISMAIRTIDEVKARPNEISEAEKLMLASIGGWFVSIESVLSLIHCHAKNLGEIQDVKQTQDKVKRAYSICFDTQKTCFEKLRAVE